MANRNTFYKRLQALGACSGALALYEGKYFTEAWEDCDSEFDFLWLIDALQDAGLFPKFSRADAKRFNNAFSYGVDRENTTCRHEKVGKVCINAMKRVVSFRQVSRALSKIDVNDLCRTG